MCEESHQPFQVLRRGRQEELLGDVPYPPQSHAAQTEALLELGEQCFDLAASSLGADISRSARQSTDHLPGRFVPVHEELAIGSRGTELFLRTPLALRCCRAIGVTSTAALQTAIAQRFSLWAVVGVLAGLIAKLVSGEEPTGLMATIDHGNVGLNATRQ